MLSLSKTSWGGCGPGGRVAYPLTGRSSVHHLFIPFNIALPRAPYLVHIDVSFNSWLQIYVICISLKIKSVIKNKVEHQWTVEQLETRPPCLYKLCFAECTWLIGRYKTVMGEWKCSHNTTLAVISVLCLWCKANQTWQVFWLKKYKVSKQLSHDATFDAPEKLCNVTEQQVSPLSVSEQKENSFYLIHCLPPKTPVWYLCLCVTWLTGQTSCTPTEQMVLLQDK